MTIEGGPALPIVLSTDAPDGSLTALPVYGYVNPPTGRLGIGGPAQPVKILYDSDLIQNGGQYRLEGRPQAVPVYLAPYGTPVLGQRPIPVYPLNLATWPNLLYDEFSDTRAAGAVNGTPAVPGPGTRVLVDTNSIMSTAGGVLVVNGTPAVNDRFRLGSVSRVVGQVFKISFPTLTTYPGAGVRFGFYADSGTDLTPSPGLRFTTVPNSLQIYEVGVSIYSIALSSLDIPFQAALITRTGIGGWTFAVSGGKYLLLYIHSLGSATAQWPKLMLTSAGAMDFTVDRWRLPQQTYIPTPLAYAAFGGGDGALGNTDAVGPDGQGSPVVAWVDQVGTWAIATNKATASALAGGLAIATVPTSSPDAHIRIALTRAGGSVGGSARFQDASNYLRFSHDGTNALCEQVVAGTPTTLRTGAAAFVADALIYLRVSGTTGWLFYNNTAIGVSFTVPASAYTNHGLYTTNTGNTMDNFEAFPDGTGGEHAALSWL